MRKGTLSAAMKRSKSWFIMSSFSVSIRSAKMVKIEPVVGS